MVYLKHQRLSVIHIKCLFVYKFIHLFTCSCSSRSFFLTFAWFLDSFLFAYYCGEINFWRIANCKELNLWTVWGWIVVIDALSLNLFPFRSSFSYFFFFCFWRHSKKYSCGQQLSLFFFFSFLLVFFAFCTLKSPFICLRLFRIARMLKDILLFFMCVRVLPAIHPLIDINMCIFLLSSLSFHQSLRSPWYVNKVKGDNNFLPMKKN